MERRLVIALALTALVLILTPILFPGPKNSPRQPVPARDTAGVALRDTSTPSTAVASPSSPTGSVAADTDTVLAAAVAPAAGDTVVVRTPLSEYRFSTLGAAPIGVRLLEHPALGTKRGGQVELVRSGTPLVSYEVVSGADTISLGTTPFSVSGDPAAAGSGAVPLQFRAAIPGGGEANISYSFVPDNYVVRVRGRITGRPLGSLLVRMPKGIQSAEADTIDDQRHLAYVYKPVRDDARSAPFGKLEGKERVEPGPFTWVGSKTKYFLVALLTEPGQLPFGNVLLRGGTKTGKNVVTADAAVLRPLSPDSTFTFEIYAGPQEWRRLHVLGRDLENANPYGGFLQGFVQPFATIVMRVLLWMHDRLALSYGWVLVIFGIVVRLILWPLNQSAMRTSLRMQRIQPELMEVQKRYRQQPEKAHQEMMRVYKDHNLSPFSMFSGCLPMLLPMPVLFALFFVFQNTIEFRGVSFLWLPDISLKDPYYIIPVIMGASMYLLSWIGMRGVPPNPQTKMMAYVFPGLMTFLFLNFPSGLNLYYAVQNIAALPQQWLISRERKKAGPPVQSPAS